MSRRPVLFSVLCAALVATVALCATSARGAGSAPAITAFDESFAKITDYTVTVNSHEFNGHSTQQRLYHYAYLKPHFEQIDIVGGDGAGGGGTWNGGDQVSGHQGGFLSRFHVKVGLHDSRATSMLGYTFVDGLVQNEVDRYKTTAGTLSEVSGPVISGQATDEVDLATADPASNNGVVKWVLYLSKETHWPVRQIGYGPNNMVILNQAYTELKTNTGLKESDFPY